MPKIKAVRIKARGNKDRIWRTLPGFGEGVYPVVKTSAMTQPVGRDEAGRLWTEPTGDGGSLSASGEGDTIVLTLSGSGNGGGNSDLPSVTEADDGKVLTVQGGKWAAAELPKYDGAYSVTPSVANAQTLATAQKYMDADVRVEKIPYYETDNTSGGTTVYIGSDNELITE